MFFKGFVYALISAPQVFAIWYLFLHLAEVFKFETAGFILSLPLYVIFPFGHFFVMLMSVFYSLVWFWLEPILYFSFIEKRYPINNSRVRLIKETSYVYIPIVIYFLRFI